MKKKVLFVINTLGHAGAEAAMLELMKQMNKDKYELSLYVLLEQGEMIDQIPEHVRLLNQKVDRRSVLSKEGKKKMIGTCLRALWKNAAFIRYLPYLLSNLFDMVKHGRFLADKLLWRILADSAWHSAERYDLAIAFLEGGSAYYVADYVNAKKKAVFLHVDYGRAGYTRKLDQDCYLKFQQIFAVSGEVKDRFLEVYPECLDRTAVFHNMIDVDKVQEKSLMDGGFTDDFSGVRLLTVGRLTWQKAYDIAIEAMYLLKQENLKTAVRWYVLGEGDQREALEKQIKKRSLQNEMILLGAKENPFPYYRQADIYVHATRFEGKSIAIQEAQILGCAIIASDCSGNREQIVDGVDGSLCELTAASVKDAILQLIEDEALRIRYREAAGKKQVVFKEDLELLERLAMDSKEG